MVEAYDQNFAVVERTSAQYRNFITRLEDNYSSGAARQGACLQCWAFISSVQRKRHTEHEPYIVTASFFKNEEAFIRLAKDHGKCSGHQSRVILFADSCQFENFNC